MSPTTSVRGARPSARAVARAACLAATVAHETWLGHYLQPALARTSVDRALVRTRAECCVRARAGSGPRSPTSAPDTAPRAASPGPLDGRPVPPPTARFRTGPSPDLVGELRVPAGRGPFPVAIIVHGGCWVSRFPGYRQMPPLAEALRAQEGIATWTVRYRRADEPGGGWPGTFTDLAAAADSLRVLARRYPLDTTRVIVVGHSSGASLGAWLAARPFLPASDSVAGLVRGPRPLAIRGVVAVDGPLDLAAFRPAARLVCGTDVLDQLLGGTPDAQEVRWRVASPAAWLGENRPALRQAVVIGGLDARRIANFPAATLREYATRTGAPAFVADSDSHFVMLDPEAPAWRAVRDAVRYVLAERP